jgi:hypothetical protein
VTGQGTSRKEISRERDRGEGDMHAKGTIIREDMRDEWTGRTRDRNETETVQ